MFSSLIIFTFAVGARSQTSQIGAQGQKAFLLNYFTKGLVSFGSNPYEGGFGGKYFIQDNLAIRGLLMFTTDNVTPKGPGGTSTSSLSLGIQGGLEYHFMTLGKISPYVGGSISYFNNGLTSTFAGGSTTGTTTDFRLAALAGVEFFFNQNASLSIEYQYGFDSSGNPDQSESQFGLLTAAITMGIYF